MKKSRAIGPGSFVLVQYVDLLAVFSVAGEFHLAICECVQCVIRADANIETRMDVCSALTNQNVSGEDELSVCSLDAEALGLGVSAVLSRAYTFFMCH